MFGDRFFIFVICAAAILVCLLSGCGGSHSGNSGRAEFRILWPEPDTRLIPAASNSIKVEIKRGGSLVAFKIAPRPAAGGSALVVFDNLPIAQVTATATAYPSIDGTGTPQAIGSVTFSVQANQTTPFSITMGSTIDHLEVSPASLTLNAAQEQTLSVAAKDAAGNIVLLASSKLEWRSSAEGVATVDASGKVRGVGSGIARITVTDTESAKSASADVTITGPVGPVSFSPAVSYSVPGADDQVLAGDYDDDGNPDVVIGTPREVVILYGRGDGTLEPYQTITSWSAGIWTRDSADMNGDGRLDILCAAYPDKVFILHNNGGRTFATPSQIPINGRPSVPRAADINGDGRMDFAHLYSPDGFNAAVAIYLNTGSAFVNAATYGAPQFAGGLTLGDLNADTKLDYAVGHWSSTVGQGGIATKIGRGDGTFLDGPGFRTGEPGNDPLIADFTGDGRIDLVINNYWSHAIAILPGRGGLDFGPVSAFLAPTYPIVMRSHDFNRDGLLDIVSGNAGPGYFSYLQSQGTNGFAETRQIPSGGDDTRSVYLADFNRDGRMDVVAQNKFHSTVSIVLNTTQ